MAQELDAADRVPRTWSEWAGPLDEAGVTVEGRRVLRWAVDAMCHAQRLGLLEAVETLTRAETIAPGEIKELRRVRQLVSDLEHFAGKRRIRGLRPLRQRIGHM